MRRVHRFSNPSFDLRPTDMRDLQQLVRQITTLPGYTSAVGTRVVRVEPGKVALALDRRADLLQFSGVFHGGVIAGLADHAAGGAASTLMPEGKIAVTVELKINYLSPAAGETIVARAETMQSGGTLSVVKVDVVSVTEGREQLCAFCTATMRAIDMPGAKRG
jgi:uncharacterized protein (TIGR00369 family)